MQIVKTKRIFATIVLSVALATSASAQTFAVKNNLLYDGAQTPNLGFELKLSDHWTTVLSGGYRPWPTDDHKEKKWRHLLVDWEMKRWFCSTFHRDFIGFNAVYSHYNASKLKFPLGLYPSVKNERRQGDFVAVGAFYGYSWILSPHWSLEALAGVDVGYTWYKRFDCVHCGEYFGKDNKPFLMPKLGINIVYNIK